MVDVIDHRALLRWRADPISFIEQCLCDPETGKPFVLSDAERWFLKFAFQLDDAGRLKFPELVFGAIKKSGKTTLAAIIMLTMLLLFGGRYAEGYCVANDLEQAQSRVFAIIKRIIAASPLLVNEARVTNDRVVFPGFHDATIIALASDAASAAGGNPTITCFDELWGYTSERSRRLFDEMVISPARKISCRLTVTYAGFSGESVLLEELHKRGMALPEVGRNLRAGDGMLFAWHHEPIAVWQSEAWLAEMRRSLRPNQFLRMCENRFVTTESSFISLEAWDACVDPAATPLLHDQSLPIYVGVDASVRHDQTAITAVAFDQEAQQVRLIFHRLFSPTPDDPLDFEATIERTLLDLQQRFRVLKCLFDPWQMQAVSQRLSKHGLNIEEFPQSLGNLTIASQNLFEIVNGRNFVAYPSAELRLAVSRAVAIETSRGWRIGKEKQSHMIDLVVALAMACHAAVDSQHETPFDSSFSWVDTDRDEPEAKPKTAAQQEREAQAAWDAQRFLMHIRRCGIKV
jgi:phage terminase large subunit-like protein